MGASGSLHSRFYRLRLGLLCRRCFYRSPFGLKATEFGRAFVEQPVSLGSGAVDGFLNIRSGNVGGFHRVKDVAAAIVETDDQV